MYASFAAVPFIIPPMPLSELSGTPETGGEIDGLTGREGGAIAGDFRTKGGAIAALSGRVGSVIKLWNSAD